MSDLDRQPPIDDALRAVPLPPGFTERVKRGIAPGAGEIDRALVRVALPAGLREQIKLTAQHELIETALRETPIPWGLAERVRFRARLASARWRTLGRLAAAASLMIALLAGQWAGIGGMLAAMRPPEAEPIPIEVVYTGPLELESRREAGIALAPPEEEIASLLEEQPAATPPIRLVDFSRARRAGPAGLLSAELAAGLNLDDDIVLLAYGPTLYTDYTGDDLPDLSLSPPLWEGGARPPLVPGFDRQFLLSTGVNPRVNPSLHPRLETSAPPLVSSAAGFQRLKGLAREGRLPDEDEIRVEHFLAALRYDFPSARPGKMRLHAAAGPSMFRSGAGLLQVGVRAGPALRRGGPAHVVVALDASASMQWAGRIELARRAIAGLAGLLGPRDRLSLVVFSDEHAWTLEGLSGDEQDLLAVALADLRPRGGTNLASGFGQAASVARRLQFEGETTHIFLVTDGSVGMPEEIVSETCRRLEEEAAAGARITVFETTDGELSDPVLSRLAAAAGGAVEQTSDAEDLQWRMAERLIGRSSLIATDATLLVTFNPKTVAAWRLLGHEPRAVSVSSEGTSPAVLHVEQEATVLYEVWLRPGAGGPVADCELVWREADAAGGSLSAEPSRQRKRIGYADFSGSSLEDARRMEEAAIAAEAAETLRRSPFAGNRRRDLSHVIEAAAAAGDDAARRPDFQDFLRTLRQTQQAR